MYRGPGAGANGPFHHYVFELYALDTKLDVKPSVDAFETRANVIKSDSGSHPSQSGLWGPVPPTAVNHRESPPAKSPLSTIIGSHGPAIVTSSNAVS